ncbi:hypothetical protein HAZT_HAZT001827 [Hyalella azteca]|uniref:Partial AB-hydrolase lipase domain-containing protein n=1 Tax=Hyalella azteca TaxID=294128 RepID=A0A6A0H9N3_HYAAZ|nr:hypothetical protein HAZT_HAZT001827 [Hyalella azteca]
MYKMYKFTSAQAQLARSRGYGASTHHVTTKDGYIIALHRLLPPPNSSRGPPARTAGAVLMMSSTAGSSSDFIINEPHESLGAQLARSRGYGASTHHVTTKDGYIIALHRLLPPPNSSRGPPARTAGAVLMMSSTAGSSSDFIINEPHESLGVALES